MSSSFNVSHKTIKGLEISGLELEEARYPSNFETRLQAYEQANFCIVLREAASNSVEVGRGNSRT